MEARRETYDEKCKRKFVAIGVKMIGEGRQDDGDHERGEEDDGANAMKGEGRIVGRFDRRSRPHGES